MHAKNTYLYTHCGYKDKIEHHLQYGINISLITTMVTFTSDTKQHDGTSDKYQRLYNVLRLFLDNGAVTWSNISVDPTEIAFYIYESRTLYGKLHKKIIQIYNAYKEDQFDHDTALEFINRIRVPMIRKGSRDHNKALLTPLKMSELRSFIYGLEYHLRVIMKKRMVMYKLIESGPDNYDEDWVIVN